MPSCCAAETATDEPERTEPEMDPGLKTGEPIPSELIARGVSGVNLSPGSLGDQLVDEVTLLIFLRHFGCIFCA